MSEHTTWNADEWTTLESTYVLDDHNQERELDAKRLLWVCRTRYVRRADIGASDFQHA